MDPLETYGCEAQPRYAGSFKVMGLLLGANHFPLITNNDNSTMKTAPQLILSRGLLDAFTDERLGDVLCISDGNDSPR